MIPLIEVGLQILNKVIPDKAAREKAQLELLAQQQAGAFREMDDRLKRDLGQMEVNKVEAATDMFRGGWRPFVGWICGAALGYQFLLRPLLAWGTALAGNADVVPPELDLGDLMTVLGGMLGLGSLRTFERIRQVGR
ncbi:MAG: holin family protein [Nitrososphaera sp.]|nr:holin family protein [Nitrososphaera sp.]